MGISSFIEKVCVQTAVYWGNPTDDGYGGKTFDDAVEIMVRWNEEGELININNGEQYMSKAEILLTQDVDKGGFIYLGTLDSLTGAQQDDPKLVDEAFEIVKFTKVPMVKSTTEFVRTCYL